MTRITRDEQRMRLESKVLDYFLKHAIFHLVVKCRNLEHKFFSSRYWHISIVSKNLATQGGFIVSQKAELRSVCM
jgi:hypothetical protein